MSSTKLTTTDIIDIRRGSFHGFTTSTLANEFGVDARHIRRIVEGTSWATVPQDQIIKNFTNYAVTIDGRVYSFNKGGYLATEEIGGQPYVRLSKTDTKGNRIRQKVAVSTLVKIHF